MGGKIIKWSTDEIDYLVSNYRRYSLNELSKHLGRSVNAITDKANKLSITRKGEELKSYFREKSLKNEKFINTQFKKNHIPYNKGVKGYVTSDSIKIENMKSTQFKKGLRPKNWKPVGSERILKRCGYIEVKIAEPNVWEQKHRLVWKKHNGDIPAGVNIQFKDGNRQNCEIDNLYVIDRHEQMKQNSYRRYGEEYARLVQLKGAVKRQINIIKRTNNEN